MTIGIKPAKVDIDLNRSAIHVTIGIKSSQSNCSNWHEVNLYHSAICIAIGVKSPKLGTSLHCITDQICLCEQGLRVLSCLREGLGSLPAARGLCCPMPDTGHT